MAAMFREERAVRVVYDAQNDTVRLVCDAGGSGVTAKYSRGDVQLLLDRDGHLVGVDLGGEALQRTVVMLGPHEAVATTVPWQAGVLRNARGSVVEVAFAGAREHGRAHEKSPYV
jgi:hypothetical protein